MGAKASVIDPDEARAAEAREMVNNIIMEASPYAQANAIGGGVEVKEHVAPHAAIFKLGGATMHYTSGKNRKAQEGYYFKPQYRELIESKNPATSRSLLYLIPSEKEKKTKRVYYLTVPRKKETPQAKVSERRATVEGDDSYTMRRVSLPSTSNYRLQDDDLYDDEGKGSCLICTSTKLLDPWISGCGHICCGECWVSWMDEHKDDQNCPECNVPIDEESLQSVTLCLACNRKPVEPWTSPCDHTACLSCWQSDRDGNHCVDSECTETVKLT